MLLRFINPIIIFCLKWKLVCLLLFSDWRAEVTNIRATSSAFKWLKFCQYVHIFININICTYLYIFVYETLSLGAWNPFNWDWNWLSNMWEHVANCWNDLPKNGCKFQWRHGGNGKNTTQHNWALGNKRKYLTKENKKTERKGIRKVTVWHRHYRRPETMRFELARRRAGGRAGASIHYAVAGATARWQLGQPTALLIASVCRNAFTHTDTQRHTANLHCASDERRLCQPISRFNHWTSL